MNRLRAEPRLPEHTHLWTLTEREHEVLTLLAQGLTNVEIAHRLGIRHGTVRTYLISLYEKLEVHTRVEAVLAGQRLGLLPAPTIPAGALDAIRREAERAQLHAERCLALVAQLEQGVTP